MERQKKIIKTGILGIIVNLILVIFKATIGIIVNSFAIILDAVNNLSDAMSSIITIIGIKLSGKAPDKEHPYGHGRIEYFASVIIAIILLLAGITALKESFEKIINPVLADYSAASLIIIITAIIVKLVYGQYVEKIGKSINSQSLIAAGTDAFMDAILSLSTLVGATISIIWHLSLEGYLGTIISFVIIKSSASILKETIDSMIGQRADHEISKKIKEEINSFDEVQGCYDLNMHNYGPSNIIASAHIQVRNDMTAEEIHILTRKITYDIFEKFRIILTTIGIYAANDDGECKEIKEQLENIISQYQEILQIHGFYIDEENKDVYFDLIIDFDADDKEKIKDEIIEKIKEKYPKYNYNIIIDSDITD